MKRLFLLLIGALFLFSFSVQAQVTAKTSVTKVLNEGVTYYEYTGVAADTCGTEQDTLYFIINTNKKVPLNCNARVEVTRTGSTDSYDIDLEGKVFENDSYVKIVENATQTASVSMYDTCGIGSSYDSPGAMIPTNFYRYYRVFIGNDGAAAAADKLTIDKVIFKIYERR